MELSNLPKVVGKRKKRLGRGLGSGRGKTAGRGTKGQKARGKPKLGFEGGQTPLIKKLPLRRGKGNPKISRKPLAVNLKVLDLLPANSLVDLENLIKAKIVDEREVRSFGVKILGEGEIKVPLTIKLPISHKATKKIEKAGGKVVWSEEKEGKRKISTNLKKEKRRK
jgi:large subunit ribosomal protein L15